MTPRSRLSSFPTTATLRLRRSWTRWSRTRRLRRLRREQRRETLLLALLAAQRETLRQLEQRLHPNPQAALVAQQQVQQRHPVVTELRPQPVAPVPRPQVEVLPRQEGKLLLTPGRPEPVEPPPTPVQEQIAQELGLSLPPSSHPSSES